MLSKVIDEEEDRKNTMLQNGANYVNQTLIN
jgi:hypothetical protein